jgi:hypothetical protein
MLKTARVPPDGTLGARYQHAVRIAMIASVVFPREAESFAVACQPFSEPSSLRGQRAKGPAVCVCSGQWPPAELPVSRREEELRVSEEFKGRCPNGSRGHAADAGELRSNRWPGHGRGDQHGDSELPRDPPCIPVTFQLDLSDRTAERSGLPEVSVESRLRAWPGGRRKNLRCSALRADDWSGFSRSIWSQSLSALGALGVVERCRREPVVLSDR